MSSYVPATIKVGDDQVDFDAKQLIKNLLKLAENFEKVAKQRIEREAMILRNRCDWCESTRAAADAILHDDEVDRQQFEGAIETVIDAANLIDGYCRGELL